MPMSIGGANVGNVAVDVAAFAARQASELDVETAGQRHALLSVCELRVLSYVAKVGAAGGQRQATAPDREREMASAP